MGVSMDLHSNMVLDIYYDMIKVFECGPVTGSKTLTLFVQEIGARPKSHKLRFQRFPMTRTTGPTWNNLSTLLSKEGKSLLKLFHVGLLVLPWGVAKMAAYDFWAMHQSPVQRVLRASENGHQKSLESLNFWNFWKWLHIKRGG